MTSASTFKRLLATTLFGTALAGCGSASRPTPPAVSPVHQGEGFVSIPVPPPLPRTPRAAPASLVNAISELQSGFQGRAGIAVRAVDDGWTVEAGGRQLLPQQSVSKLWVAMTVMDLRDQGKIRLDEPILVRPQDLTLFHQPIAILVKGDGYRTTIGDLLTRALTHSDNTANDRLLTRVGGPSAVRSMIARKQLGAIRFGPGERLLQSGTAGLVWHPSYAVNGGFMTARDRLSPAVREAALNAYVRNPPDGAAPIAIADAIARLAKGDLLSETSTKILLDMMGRSVTGRARLRAALPSGWEIAHKTGTGQDLGRRNAGFNDVGLLTAPDGRRYGIAVMIGDTIRPMPERQKLIQAAAAAVANYAGTTRPRG